VHTPPLPSPPSSPSTHRALSAIQTAFQVLALRAHPSTPVGKVVEPNKKTREMRKTCMQGEEGSIKSQCMLVLGAGVCMYACMCILCVCIHMCTCVCIYMYIHVSAYKVFMYTLTHTHTHIHTYLMDAPPDDEVSVISVRKHALLVEGHTLHRRRETGTPRQAHVEQAQRFVTTCPAHSHPPAHAPCSTSQIRHL
jgi:hypothetical protein